ncbi:hypothetical protein R5R35_012845 [Gryllus longicercus]|uniref:Nucleoporin Nup37 n=1 Tax=Gryllus longicercus TaxID=2509291 RepID=A0AAN9V7W1_9ORTH
MDTPAATPLFVEFKDQVLFAEFSPYEWSPNLICIAFHNNISVGRIKFQEEDDEMEEEIDFQVLHKFFHEVRPDCLAWNPESSISTLPKHVSFCTGGADYQLRLFESDLSNNHSIQVLEGHTYYINSIAYDMDGEYLASGSDDSSCRLWAIKDKYSCFAVMNFRTAVVSVCFHQEEPGKLMVALKKGKIIQVNVNTQQRIMTFDCGTEPLLSADWSPSNSLCVVAVAEQELTWWDTSKSRNPVESRMIHTTNACAVRCCPLSDTYVATFGEPDHQLKVLSLNSNVPQLIANLQLTTNISWHHHLPYVCAGNDYQLGFWKVTTK